MLRSAVRRRAFSVATDAGASSVEGWASSVTRAGIAAAVPTTTHSVFNQADVLTNFNAFTSDPSLAEVLMNYGATWAAGEATSFGAHVGDATMQTHAHNANAHKPVLHTHDRYGNELGIVDYHPSYHVLQQLAIEKGVAGFAWEDANNDRPGALVARCVLNYMMYQLEPGVCCPTTMTFAATPALLAADAPALSGAWLPLLASREYDPRNVPLGAKAGAIVGMSMTEKQGGSDVRANTTVATPVHASRVGAGDEFTLVGHKWFTSAPMSDAFLTLAQVEGVGLSCFLVPRWLPDGTRNAGFRIIRLKEKLGDHSNASSEVEYANAWGVMVGAPGKGVRTIVEMVVHTRLDCAIGSAALMRQCAQLAAHHAATRDAFGSRLASAPLMRAVLADLAVETEAANALWPRLAHAFERSAEDAHEAAFRRLATAIAKYWVCKRAPSVAYEAMECLGGNGYVEGGGAVMARLYRQAPLNAIWEGSGNVIALDILRALATERGAAAALLAELEQCAGADARLDALTSDVQAMLRAADPAEAEARRRLESRARLLVDKMAVALQASILIRRGDPAAAAAYCASRLPSSSLSTAAGGWNYGALNDFGDTPTEQILIDRLTPRREGAGLC